MVAVCSSSRVRVASSVRNPLEAYSASLSRTLEVVSLGVQEVEVASLVGVNRVRAKAAFSVVEAVASLANSSHHLREGSSVGVVEVASLVVSSKVAKEGVSSEEEEAVEACSASSSPHRAEASSVSSSRVRAVDSSAVAGVVSLEAPSNLLVEVYSEVLSLVPVGASSVLRPILEAASLAVANSLPVVASSVVASRQVAVVSSAAEEDSPLVAVSSVSPRVAVAVASSVAEVVEAYLVVDSPLVVVSLVEANSHLRAAVFSAVEGASLVGSRVVVVEVSLEGEEAVGSSAINRPLGAASSEIRRHRAGACSDSLLAVGVSSEAAVVVEGSSAAPLRPLVAASSVEEVVEVYSVPIRLLVVVSLGPPSPKGEVVYSVEASNNSRPACSHCLHQRLCLSPLVPVGCCYPRRSTRA